MNITEAVESAVDYLPHERDCDSRPDRDCQCRHLRIATMRAILEAAAPHMLSAAWDDGHSAGIDHADGLDGGSNPYDRPTP